MVKSYVDTSCLFSLYAKDANSARVDEWRKANAHTLPFTRFHRVELRNALSLAVYQKRCTEAEILRIWGNVENDLKAGNLVSHGGWWHRTLLEAEQLAAKFSMQFGARTLDVIHVAAALSLNAEEFCTTDLRQAKLASQVQLKVVIP